MNNKSVEREDAAFENEPNMGDVSRLETTSETRKDRIRRLNRERQRRRRQKLKLSRQAESGLTTTSPQSNVNLFETQHERNEDGQTLNAELTNPSGQRKNKPTRRRQSPRKLKIKQENEFEVISSDLTSTNTTSQADICHENANEAPSSSSGTVCVQIPVPLVATEIEVGDENYFDDEEAEFLDELGSSGDEEQNLKPGDSYRRKSELSEEELATRREYYRDRERKKRQTMTPNEVSARREKQRELKRKQKERMTPDQIEALRARYREWRRKRKETMTPEQLEIIRRGNRERQRRRRERLGIRKRAGTSQGKSVNDNVLLGIKNRHERSFSETDAMFSMTDVVTPQVKRGKTSNPRGSATTTARKQSMPSVQLGVTQATVTPASNVLPNVSTLPGSNQVPPTHQSQSTTPMGIPLLQTTPLQGLSTASQAGVQNTVSVPATGASAIYQSMPLPGVQGFLHSMPVVSGAQGTMLTGFQGAQMQGMGTGTFIPPTMNKDGQVLHSISTLLPVAPMQGMGQGLTFLTPVTGTMAAVQGFPDPRYVMAAPVRPQASPHLVAQTQQATGLAPGVETANITAPPEPVQPVTAEIKVSESEIQPQNLGMPEISLTTINARGKGRGRKRAAAVAAADVLASLSAGSQGNTPMSSMLSAMASAKGVSSSQQVSLQTTPPQEQASNIANTKQQSNEQETFQNIQVGPNVNIQQLNQSSTPQQSVMTTMSGKTPLNQPTTVVQQQSLADRKSYTTLTTAVTTLPMDMNANTFPGFPGQNVAGFSAFKGFETLFANISNPSLYRGGPYGMPIVDTRSGNVMGYSQLSEQQLNAGNRISIAVETDEIKRASVATNTGETDNDIDINKVNLESIGTMTDSLYKASVATATDDIGAELASKRTDSLKEMKIAQGFVEEQKQNENKIELDEIEKERVQRNDANKLFKSANVEDSETNPLDANMHCS